MAGAPGFEPGMSGPKPLALPLGYAPADKQNKIKCQRDLLYQKSSALSTATKVRSESTISG